MEMVEGLKVHIEYFVHGWVCGMQPKGYPKAAIISLSFASFSCQSVFRC